MSEKLSDRLRKAAIANRRAAEGAPIDIVVTVEQLRTTVALIEDAAQLATLVERWQEVKRKVRLGSLSNAADLTAYGAIDDELLVFDLGVSQE